MSVPPRYSVGHSFVSDSGAIHKVVFYDNTRRSPGGRRDPAKYLCECSRCHGRRWLSSTRISEHNECIRCIKDQRLCEVCGEVDESLFKPRQSNRCMACDRAWHRHRSDLAWGEFVAARRELFMQRAIKAMRGAS